MEMQHADTCLSRVLFFVEWQRKPSRRECPHEAADVLCLLRHWGKLSVRTGVLYRVSKNIFSKKKSKGSSGRSPSLGNDSTGMDWTKM